MRIVRIIDRLNIGGPARHVTWLTAGEQSSEFETLLVTGVVPPGEGDMTWFARQAGLCPLVIPEMSRELSPRDLLVVWKLLRLFRRFRPDIVETHKAKAGAVGRLAVMAHNLTTGSRCRVVHIYHGHIFHSYYGKLKTSLFLWIERVLAWLATDRIITISEQQRREIGEWFRVGRLAQHVVIPLGIDLAPLEAACAGEVGQLHREVGLGTGIPLVGIVGRLCEVKNQSMFVDVAASLINESAADAEFVVIGDGHLRPALEAQADRLGVRSRLHFTGFRDDIMSLYPSLAIIALTSLNEGTPLTLIEGMGCGVPVVSTEVGGVVDLMGGRLGDEPGMTIREHGITVATGDTAGFATAVRYLLDHPAERQAMGERAREFVRSKLSLGRMIGDVHDLYRDLCRDN